MNPADRINGLLNRNPTDFIYWVRVLLAIVVALICAILRLDAIGVFIGTVSYLISYALFRYIIKIDPDKVDGEAKLYTIGFGSYFAIWITVWALLSVFLV